MSEERAVCMDCWIRLHDVEDGTCWRCGRDELIFPGHWDFERIWEEVAVED